MFKDTPEGQTHCDMAAENAARELRLRQDMFNVGIGGMPQDARATVDEDEPVLVNRVNARVQNTWEHLTACKARVV